MPMVQKIPRADRVIRNEGSIEETAREVERIWENLQWRRMKRRNEIRNP